jgi:hypothetical protein
MRRSIALASLALSVLACSKSKESDRVPLATAPAAPAAAMGDVVTGTLLEQIAASPYVYLRIKTANGEVWAAVNEARLTIGAPVTVFNAMLMEKFDSRTLKRTFDRIYFGSLEAPPSVPPAGMAGSSAAPSSAGTPPAVDARVPKVAKAAGADARTIAEVWSEQGALTGKSVSIRGVVVKYNPGVMGKNWIHLQDGSGDAAKGTHDITVTTMDAATVGATVTITGAVHTKRDFGAGYSYAVIVEDAKVVAK